MTLPLSDPVLIFALTMVIILLAPIVFVRLRMPGLVGLIVTGAIVGPSGLGLLARDATFELLGTVGLLYLMFTAGLSIDFEQFTRLRTRSVVFGAVSFLMPFALALTVGPLLGYGWAAAVLLGAIVGSHTLLAYPLARRLGLDKHPAVVMAMGGTLVTDLASLLLLAVVTQVEAGATGVGVWVRFAGLVALFGAAVTLGLPRLGRWFFRAVRQQPDVHFVFLLAVVFSVAYAAGLVGLAPIIGAFLAGLVLNRLVPEQSPLMTRIRFVGDALFIPFFLLSVGMLVDLGALGSSLTLWTVALAFIALVLVGKGLAAALVGRLYRHSRDEAWTLYGLSTPQAAATLAVTLVGFEIGLFSELAVNAVVLLILVTCLLGPFLVERYGRRVARAEAAAGYRMPAQPQRLLVALANPETAEDLTDVALLLRDRDAQQPIYPMTVVREGPGADARVAEGEAMLGRSVLHTAAADVPVTPLTRLDLNVAGGIVRAIREERITTVVIGWQGEPTPRSFIFGSVLDQLLRESREMVVVCRLHGPIATTRRVVVAIPPYLEREPGFAAALRTVKLVAKGTGAVLVVLAPAEAAGDVEVVRRTKPDVPLATEPLAHWDGLLDALGAVVAPDDLLVLMTTRTGSVAWQPSLDRLPGLLASRFRSNGLLTVYPAEVPLRTRLGEAAPGEAARAASLLDAADEEHIRLDLRGEEEDVLRALLDGAIPAGEATADELLARLRRGRSDDAVALRPGVAFYHAHTRRVQRSRLFVGVSRDGVRLPSVPEPVHVVLIFLSPRAVPPEDYLRQLAAVAHFVHDAVDVGALRAAETHEEVQAVLRRRKGATDAA